MLAVYPAYVIVENDGGCSVIFPDLNDLATCGDDEKEAMEMAVDCLAAYIHWLKQDGEDIPEPSPASSINLKKISKEFESEIDIKSVYTAVISVDVEEYAAKHFEKSVKKTLSIPEWIDKAAKKKGINFSKTLQEALLAKIM